MKRSSKAITKANNATASVNAKPKIAIPKTSFFAAGFLPTAVTNDAKIFPIPPSMSIQESILVAPVKELVW